jgi:hypothetical protein
VAIDVSYARLGPLTCELVNLKIQGAFSRKSV